MSQTVPVSYEKIAACASQIDPLQRGWFLMVFANPPTVRIIKVPGCFWMLGKMGWCFFNTTAEIRHRWSTPSARNVLKKHQRVCQTFDEFGQENIKISTKSHKLL